MRVVLAGLLLTGVAAAAPDARSTYAATLARLAQLERQLGWDYGGRFEEVLDVFEAPVVAARAQPHKYPTARWDYVAIRLLYGDFTDIAVATARADREFAASGHPDALPALFDTLLRVAKDIDRIERDLERQHPRWLGLVFDQRPAIVREELAVRLQGLVEALATCPGAASFCAGEGLATARKKDGRRSIVRRVAVMDVLARTGGPEAIEALATLADAKESSLRVAAVEGLVRLGPAARPRLVPRLHDPNPIVRRALLFAIAIHAAADPGWIGPLVAHFEGSVGGGAEHAFALRALEALTRQRFGYAPDRWRAWYEANRAAIDAGRFDASTVTPGKVTPAPCPDAVTFYGVAAPVHGVVFVVTGGQAIVLPAEWKVQSTKWRDVWSGTRPNWEREFASHRTVLRAELEATLGGLREEERFGLVVLHGAFSAAVVGDRLLEPGRAARRQVLKEVERLPGSGYCSQLEGFRAAARVGGLGPDDAFDLPEPAIDTVFLLDSGDPGGGRFMTPEAAVAAFARWNRFRRLVVHAIRICHEGEPAETVMRGIAEASGGAYRWAAQPPALPR